MPLCISNDASRLLPRYAHTPQPDEPPPTGPDEPDEPPIGDPPPEPDELPHSRARRRAHAAYPPRAVFTNFMYLLQDARSFYRHFRASNT